MRLFQPAGSVKLSPVLSLPRGTDGPRKRGAETAAATAGDACAAAAHAAAAAAAAGRDGGREVAVLGGEDFILSQRSGVSEELFKGGRLGVDADVAGGSGGGGGLQDGMRLSTLSHLPAGLEPPPRFLQRVALHFARNALAGLGQLQGQVPLVLGIWGPKGVGKTFSLELSLRALGVLPVCLSAGELEDEWAGEPGRRLRERYQFAARHAESTGQPTCLVISDLDAGVGTWAHTANTVNTQNLQGSLMALCDDPDCLSTGQDWAAVRRRPRVPIYVTANDLTCLYAPLVREGRMDKFLFEPSRGEMAAALCLLFSPQLPPADVDALLAAFPHQPMDFFGAIKSRMVDGAVRSWLHDAAAAAAGGGGGGGGGEEGVNAALAQLAAGNCSPSINQVEEQGCLAAAMAAGASLAAEQQAVLDTRLSLEYVRGLEADRKLASERSARWRRSAASAAARRVAAAQAAEELRRAAADVVRSEAAAARAAAAVAGWDAAHVFASSQQQQQQQRQEEEKEEEEAEAGPPPTASGLPPISPDELWAATRSGGVRVLDVRSAREWDWGRIKGAIHTPIVLAAGPATNPAAAKLNPGFMEAATAALGSPDAAPPIVLYGPGTPLHSQAAAAYVSKEQFVSIAPAGAVQVEGQDIVAAAAAALQSQGYCSLRELAGGYRAWDLQYRPDGRRRAKGAFRDKSSGELEWWTASN
ncbi:hypothetical protein D9Q98_010264 [Chlorella vulgaris]|uniref:Ribulose bisphosphate carboxylase/oxygenase activase, chloroplastic n=1 Tax=Chlorella vulgaris TaxID=3077 RepID=A0A9D4TJU2_CHLVU|nr:hypothetical protein D9Q98_010264 [Chlorella vulgaris]